MLKQSVNQSIHQSTDNQSIVLHVEVIYLVKTSPENIHCISFSHKELATYLLYFLI